MDDSMVLYSKVDVVTVGTKLYTKQGLLIGRVIRPDTTGHHYKVIPPTLNTIPLDKPIDTRDIEYADL